MVLVNTMDNAIHTSLEHMVRTIEHSSFRCVNKRVPAPRKRLYNSSTNSMRLAGKASMPAGGRFIALLLAGGPFIFSPLIHKTSVLADGLFVSNSTSQLTFRCRFGHSCPSVQQLTFQVEVGKVHLAFIFQVCVRSINLPLFKICMTTRNYTNLCLAQTYATACKESRVQLAEKHYKSTPALSCGTI